MERIDNSKPFQTPQGKPPALTPLVGRKPGKGGRGRNFKSASKKEPTVRDSGKTVMVVAPKFPPQFNALPTYKLKRRWVQDEAVAVTDAPFTIAAGHRQFKVNVTTTTTTMIVECWRIRKISVWCLNYIDNSTAVTIQPVGLDVDTNNYNDRDQAFTCTSMSEAEPGHMAIVPGDSTPLGSWHRTSTVNSAGILFYMNCDHGGANSGDWANVILDIDFEFVLNFRGAPLGYTTTTGAATVGTLSGENLFSSGTGMVLQAVNQVF